MESAGFRISSDGEFFEDPIRCRKPEEALRNACEKFIDPLIT